MFQEKPIQSARICILVSHSFFYKSRYFLLFIQRDGSGIWVFNGMSYSGLVSWVRFVGFCFDFLFYFISGFHGYSYNSCCQFFLISCLTNPNPR
jgi:hypothetical protein